MLLIKINKNITGDANSRKVEAYKQKPRDDIGSITFLL